MASGADLLWKFRQQASPISRPNTAHSSMPNETTTSETNTTAHIGGHGTGNSSNDNKDMYNTSSSAISRVVSPISEYKYEPTNSPSGSIEHIDSIGAMSATKPTPRIAASPAAVGKASKIHIVVCTGSNCGSTRVGRTERETSATTPTVWPSHNQTQPLDDCHTATTTRYCGVSAALLEIEELVQEVVSSSSPCSSADVARDASGNCPTSGSNQGIIDVTSGGCVGHCSMGPTVSVLIYPRTNAMAESAATTTTSSRMAPSTAVESTVPTIHYFHQVNSVTACEYVVQAATALASDSTEQIDPMPHSLGIEATSGLLQESTGSRNHQSLLMRRAQGLRWKALREMARDVVRKSAVPARQCTPHPLSSSPCGSRDLLKQAMNAELSAVRPDREKMIRAQRRHARFIAMLDQTHH
jgi:hypothetical protein